MNRWIRVKPLWSEIILEEVRNTLINDIKAPEERVTARIQGMRNAFKGSMVTNFENLVPMMKNHPKNRHVLAVAVRTGCALMKVDVNQEALIAVANGHSYHSIPIQNVGCS